MQNKVSRLSCKSSYATAICPNIQDVLQNITLAVNKMCCQNMLSLTSIQWMAACHVCGCWLDATVSSKIVAQQIQLKKKKNEEEAEATLALVHHYPGVSADVFSTNVWFPQKTVNLVKFIFFAASVFYNGPFNLFSLCPVGLLLSGTFWSPVFLGFFSLLEVSILIMIVLGIGAARLDSAFPLAEQPLFLFLSSSPCLFFQSPPPVCCTLHPKHVRETWT